MRALKFVKYLPLYGWRPIVLTVQPQYYRLVDESLLAEIPNEAEIFRTGSWEPKGRSYQKLLDTYHGSPSGVRKALKSLRWRLYSYFLVHQDEEFLWLPHAWRAVNRILQEQAVDVVLTTSPPNCVQWLGIQIFRRYRLPWVVDLRDAWVENPLFQARFPLRGRVEARVERRVVESADRLVTATPPIGAGLAQRYPSCHGKIEILLNGFDPADFDGQISAGDNGYLDLVYVGSMASGTRPIEPLLKAVAILLKTFPESGTTLRVLFVGSFGPSQLELLDRYRLRDIVSATGWVAHEAAIQHMVNADILLVISSEGEGGQDVLTGKVFEYIAAGRPILALVPDQAAVGHLVRDEGLGWVASPTDVEQITSTLRDLVQQYQAGKLERTIAPDIKVRFDRREQTKVLARILTQVTDHAPN